MPLSPEIEQRIRAAAEAAGYSADEAVAIANGEEPEPAKAGPVGKSSAPPAEVKIFQYHLPFMKVVELRSYLGLTERIADDEMLCGEFLEEHGGAMSGAPAKSEAPPTE